MKRPRQKSTSVRIPEVLRKNKGGEPIAPLFHIGSDNMNILAIDQARNGAWSVFDHQKKELLGYGTFSFDSKKYTYAKAVLHIEELVDMLIKAWDIEAVFIEDINLRANVQAFKRLAQLQGVLVNFFEKNEYLYGYVVPTQWQNYCKAQIVNSEGGRRLAEELKAAGEKQSKIPPMQFIWEQFGIRTENDNLADAICIGSYVVNNVTIAGRNNKRTKGE